MHFASSRCGLDIRPVASTLTGARNSGCVYARADIAALKEKLSRLVTPGVADRTLGLGKGKTALLTGAGLVTVHQWNRYYRKSERRSVDLADVEKIFDRIRGLAVAAAPAQPIAFETFQTMAVARRVIGFAELIGCLLSGELRGYLADASAPGLDALVFERADAVEMLGRLASSARTGEMVLGEVVRRLGIPAKAVHQLVTEGLLPQPRRVCAYIFDANAVRAFREQFIYDTELARQHRTRPAEVRQRLAATGARPVTTIETGREVTIAVYRKAEVNEIR